MQESIVAGVVELTERYFHKILEHHPISDFELTDPEPKIQNEESEELAGGHPQDAEVDRIQNHLSDHPI